MSAAADPGGLREELRAYYRPLLPIWDRTLADRGDEPLWRWAARVRDGDAALELGAGSGRITGLLAGSLRPVVAVDLNPDALREARERLAGSPGVHLVQADLRSLRLGRRFGLVAAANDPFSHLRTDEGRDRALAAVAAHLEPGGDFLLDALWFPEDVRRAAASPGGKTTEQRMPPAEGEAPMVVRHTWRCDPETGRCRASFECRRGDGATVRSSFAGRFWTPGEVEERFARAGLRVADLWGDYGRGGWSPDCRQMVVRASPAG